jgi:hypothetical protein
MIIVKLIGGLGNQMFQYAVGRSLAQKYNTELKLDIRDFKHYTLRNYSLNYFNIVDNFATPVDLSLVLLHSEKPVAKAFKYIIRNTPLVQPIEHIKEKGYNFQENILNLRDNVYLDGYWQSEKYFLDIEEIIKKEFSTVNPLTKASQDIADQIKDCESVSIHVRRGDYVSDPTTNSIHGVCGLEYYCKAIDLIREKVDTPHFFIISDDPEWACCNIKPDAPTTYVRRNDSSKDYEDMCLMSMCKYHIIANSSFSWWGAWLSGNPDKIVIAPRRWFNQKECNINDRLPESWIKL